MECDILIIFGKNPWSFQRVMTIHFGHQVRSDVTDLTQTHTHTSTTTHNLKCVNRQYDNTNFIFILFSIPATNSSFKSVLTWLYFVNVNPTCSGYLAGSILKELVVWVFLVDVLKRELYFCNAQYTGPIL